MFCISCIHMDVHIFCITIIYIILSICFLCYYRIRSPTLYSYMTIALSLLIRFVLTTVIPSVLFASLLSVLVFRSCSFFFPYFLFTLTISFFSFFFSLILLILFLFFSSFFLDPSDPPFLPPFPSFHLLRPLFHLHSIFLYSSPFLPS